MHLRNLLADVPAWVLRLKSMSPPSYQALLSTGAIQDVVHMLEDQTLSKEFIVNANGNQLLLLLANIADALVTEVCFIANISLYYLRL